MRPASKSLFAAVSLAAAIAVIACSWFAVGENGGRDENPDRAPRSEQEGAQIREVTVGPARAECYGPFRRMCLVVDGGLFYDEIEGFEHEPGYEYRLKIERYDAWPDQKEPPQDASRYGYRLLEVISKTPVAGAVTEATITLARG